MHHDKWREPLHCIQGLVKGAILCFRNPYFYFRHGESTSTASQLTSPASQKSKDLNKVSLLLQDLAYNTLPERAKIVSKRNIVLKVSKGSHPKKRVN